RPAARPAATRAAPIAKAGWRAPFPTTAARCAAAFCAARAAATPRAPPRRARRAPRDARTRASPGWSSRPPRKGPLRPGVADERLRPRDATQALLLGRLDLGELDQVFP